MTVRSTKRVSLALRAKIAHLQVRADLRQKRFLGRAARVLRELLALNYHRFRHPDSNDWDDVMVDIMPHRLVLLISRLRRLRE